MPLITLLLIAQSFFDFENKQVFYPEPLRAESTHSYDVLSYLIELELPMNSRNLAGAVTMSARSTEDNLTVLDVYLLGLNVDSVKVDGIVASYTHAYETVYVNLPQPYNQGDSFDLMIGYSGTGSGDMGYLWYGGPNTISYTLGCPFSAKRWMPCYDVLWDKADYGVEFYITVPDSFTVCANGAYLGKTVAAGKATYHWQHGYPIAPYLIHFASSKFTTYSDWYVPTPAESIEIMYHFWPQDSLNAPNAFSLCTDMMYFYDSLFGEYPFERYGMDIVSPFYYGGMEHQTMATIIRSWILGTPNFYGLAHEMSHMWWGDMVTCFGWKNVWLNEGFGTYSDALYRERREGHQAFIDIMIARRSSYFVYEAAYPRPLYDPPEDSLFDLGHTYHKASWVCHMIRYLCADDAVWLDFLAAFRDSFAYGAASTDDLNRIMNQELGGNYDWFFDEWVYDMGYPIYDVVWNKIYESPNWRLIMDVTQTQTIGPPVFHMPLPIGVDYASGDTLLTLTIDQSPEHYEFVLSQEPMSITVDPETWVIQKNTVTGVEEYVERTVSLEHITSIGRAIDLKLTAPSVIKVFDIIGRKVCEETGDVLHFTPASAGIYHVIIGEKNHRVVIVK